MAKQNFDAHKELVEGGDSGMPIEAYIEKLRGAKLAPSSWLDARHAGAISVRRNENGEVTVYPSDGAIDGQVQA